MLYPRKTRIPTEGLQLQRGHRALPLHDRQLLEIRQRDVGGTSAGAKSFVIGGNTAPIEWAMLLAWPRSPWYAVRAIWARGTDTCAPSWGTESRQGHGPRLGLPVLSAGYQGTGLG
jgi:hypothetical protein